jgi:hypothetical protein
MAKRMRQDQLVNSWEDTLKIAVNSIVCIRFSQVAAFDTDGPTTSEATGFVVDANRGIILTNRHGLFVVTQLSVLDLLLEKRYGSTMTKQMFILYIEILYIVN